MTQQEQDLQDALLNSFLHNLKFLEEYDNDLFHRINSLSDLINTNQYTERYILEYIKDNGDFDIYDSVNDSYIYNKKPKQWNNKAISSTNLDLVGSINLLNPKLYEVTGASIPFYEEDTIERNELELYKEVEKYKNIKKASLYDKQKKLKEINKFLFVGTLLGRHIPKTVQKLNSTNHFVCEENLEIFRLSLFVCDYSIMARDGKSVVFSIMEEEDVFINKFYIFFRNNKLKNNILKYFCSNYNISNYFDRIINAATGNDPSLHAYNIILDSLLNRSTSNFNKYKTLKFEEINLHKNIFEDTNVIFTGAGPSLVSNMAWLKEHQNKFMVVSMAAAVDTLLKHDIKPDIIVTLDSREDAVRQLSNVGTKLDKNCIKFISLISNKKIFDFFNTNSKTVYGFEPNIGLREKGILLDGFSIGEVTFKMLLNLNVKNIYLLGLDLALNQKTGDTHIRGHERVSTFEIDKNKQYNESILNQSFSLDNETILTKGNFHDEVVTTRILHLSLKDYLRAMIMYRKEDQTIYNLSEHGAFIEGTIPTKIETMKMDFATIDKEELHKSLLNILDKISVKLFEDCDKSKVKREIEKVEEVLVEIEKFKNLNIKSYAEFAQETKFIVDMAHIGPVNTYFLEIVSNFYAVINRYIDFVYNDRKLKDNKKMIQKFRNIWCESTQGIATRYIEYMKRLLK